MAKNTYKQTTTTVSMIRYHFVFCPRYRRKIFLIRGMEERFRELVLETCRKHGLEVISMACGTDHVYLFLEAMPDQSPSEIMNRIKGDSSPVLRKEFPELTSMTGLWTRNYLVSTEEGFHPDTIRQYVETQKTRP